MSSCLGRTSAPVKRVWRGLSGRRRRRTTGKQSTYAPVTPEEDDRSDDDTGVGGGVLGRLRKEVRTCEYRDVHVMWEMLSGSNGCGAGNGRNMADNVAGKGAPERRRTRRRSGRTPPPWGWLVTYCCGAF